MGQNTEELSTTPADIEATRADLSRSIDELSDKVSPQRVVERRKEAAKNSLASVRDKVMGSANDAKSSIGSAGSGAGGSASGAASSVKDSAQSAVGTLESTTVGHPLTAGAVAFGAGMLLSALLPASEREAEAARRLVDAAKEQGQPLLDEVKSVGQEIGKDLGGQRQPGGPEGQVAGAGRSREREARRAGLGRGGQGTGDQFLTSHSSSPAPWIALGAGLSAC